MADAIRRTSRHDAVLIDLGAFIQNTPEAQHACQRADLLVIHQHFYGDVIPRAQEWKACGKKILIDFDEPSEDITSEMPNFSFWREGLPTPMAYAAPLYGKPRIQPLPFEQFRCGLRAVDAAIVPSMRLVDDWSATVRTLCIPDYLNTDQYRALRTRCPDKIRIGVSGNAALGTYSHECGLLPALERVCAQRPEVEIHFFNSEVQAIARSRIPAAQYMVENELSVYQRPAALAHVDIGIAPAEGKYGVRTSRIHTLEFMVLKTPWLASDLPPYRELGRYGWLISNKAERWERSILEVIDHLDAYEAEAAGEPFLFGISQDVNENVEKILHAYETLL